MNDDPQPPPLPTSAARRPRGLSCFVKGCLLTITVLMLIGVGIGGIGVLLYKSAHAYYTEQPVPVRTFEATDYQYQAVLAKLQPFNEAANEGRAATVELDADDLNTLIARAPQFAALRGRTFVAIVNGQLVLDLSFPLTDDSGPGQRFINARATADASFAIGKLTLALRHVSPLHGEANDGLLPSMLRNPAFLQGYSDKINRDLNGFIRDQARTDPPTADILGKLRTVVVTEDKLVATSVERPDAPLPSPSPTVSPVATPPKTE